MQQWLHYLGEMKLKNSEISEIDFGIITKFKNQNVLIFIIDDN